MRKTVAAVAAVLVSLLTLGGFASSAEAAVSYPSTPTPTIVIKLSSHRLVGGKTFTVTVSTKDTQCNWKVSFLSQTATATGKSLRHTFHTPAVSAVTPLQVSVSCTYGTTSGSGGAAIVVRSEVAQASATVTLLPLHHAAAQAGPANLGGGSAMPNTGGPSLWVLLAGVFLLLVGGSALVRGRRRTTV